MMSINLPRVYSCLRRYLSNAFFLAIRYPKRIKIRRHTPNNRSDSLWTGLAWKGIHHRPPGLGRNG